MHIKGREKGEVKSDGQWQESPGEQCASLYSSLGSNLGEKMDKQKENCQRERIPSGARLSSRYSQ